MGFLDDMKDSMDVSRKYQLREDIPIEELYEKIKAAMPEETFGEIVLKKGIGGKHISFKGCDRTKVTLSAKKGVATLKRYTDTEAHSSVSVMGVGFRTDGKNAFDIQHSGNEYFKAVAAALDTILL